MDAGTSVEIMEQGNWIGPFTVTGQTGRTPDHLVLAGPHGAFEIYNDAPFNVRPVAPTETPTETPARTIIATALVQNPRTPNQVKDAVRTLNRKLAKLTSWRGISTTLYTLEATLEDGAIAIRMVEPDRTLTGQPDRVWSELYLDVNQSAVSLYRHGKWVHLDGLGKQITAHLEDSARRFGTTIS